LRGALLSLGLAAAAVAQVAPTASRPSFRDIADEAGIAFRHRSAPEKKYILESMVGGVGLLDFDGDGLLDVYLTDSPTVETAKDPKAARSALYRNLGHGRFEDVTDRAGVAHGGWAMGVCTADVDGDGWEDIYVTALDRNMLYHNTHDGTFTDIAEASGLAASGWSAGCGFADYDRDGDLDLFVDRYVQFDLDQLPLFGQAGPGMKGTGRGADCKFQGIAVQCGPRGLPGETDFLFQNDGTGHFTEVGEKAGVHDPNEYFGLGVAWFDFNDDGWPDLYVANDSGPNFLYQNQKDGTFKDVAFPMGVAVSEDGGEQGSMGVAVGDYDGSGRLSLFVTDFSQEYDALYRNDGTYFTDVSYRSKSAASSLPFVKWGTAFFDYDNDGFLDIIVANGHVYPQLDKSRLGPAAGYRQRRLLYHNLGDGTFEEIAEQAGTAMTEERATRGLAVGDLDNDGRLDVVISDIDGAPLVLRNETPDAGHWLMVRLRGKGKNTSAVGAVVTARVGKRAQMRLVQSGSSYISQEDKRLHFGLGAESRVDALDVRWPDGTATHLEGVKADQILTVEEPR
jgi:hypothetical protein